VTLNIEQYTDHSVFNLYSEHIISRRMTQSIWSVCRTSVHGLSVTMSVHGISVHGWSWYCGSTVSCAVHGISDHGQSVHGRPGQGGAHPSVMQ